MKLIKLLVIIFLSLNTLHAQEGWFFQHPSPQGNNLNDVFVIDNNRMIAVGSNGTILTTQDKGETWKVNYYKEYKTDLAAMNFINPDTGWICGSNGILLKTVNGGRLWNTINVSDSIDLNKVYFWNSLEGCAVGYSDLTDIFYFLKTNDGGENWSLTNIPRGLGWQNASFFINKNFGWISVGDTLFKTTDGGAHWNALSGKYFNSLYFLDKNNGWAVSVGCWSSCWFILFKTSDGGLTWREIFNGIGPYEYVFFKDYNSGWIIGENNFRTTDGGITWDTCLSSPYSTSKAIAFNEDGSIGYIVGSFGSIFQTTDCGNSWSVKSNLVTNYNLNSIFFTDQNNGWAVGGQEVLEGGDMIVSKKELLNTVNGGLDWRKYNLTYGGLYNDIYFADEYTGWIVGKIYPHGIYKTTDGKNWDFVNLPGGYDSVNNYNSVYFINPDTGWIAGSTSWNFDRGKNDQGVIQKTTNGGYTWQKYKIDSENTSLNDIRFLNRKKGFVVGDNGIILATNDGGESWTNLQLAESEISFTCIFFDKNNNGWIAGYRKNTPPYKVIIYMTTDVGNSWISTEINSTNLYKINSLWFNDLKYGFAVGGNLNSFEQGTILISKDGGMTWELDSSVNSAELNSIYFLDGNIGWIAGGNGVILKTNTGGLTNVKDISSESEIYPKYFILYQNYPNPFNPTTTIKYSIPAPTPPSTYQGEGIREGFVVSLKIYDILGREIAVLVNEEQKPGYYEVKWNANNHASGIYFCRMTAGDPSASSGQGYVETKKMVLLR